MYYPVFVELAGRACLVVGGGPVAERKVDGLLTAGARVTVVASAVTGRLEALAGTGAIAHVARPYEVGDLAGFELAFVATDDPDVSASVCAEGRDRGVWVNAADDAAHSDFILPSVVRRGRLTVAIGTGGASPALAAVIKDELERYFTQDYAALTEVVADVRRELRQRGRASSGEAWRRALDADLRRLVAEGRTEEARARLIFRLRAGPCA